MLIRPTQVQPLPSEPDIQCHWKTNDLINHIPGLRDLTGMVDWDRKNCIGCGGSADVYKGIWRVRSAEMEYPEVAVKVLRVAFGCNQNEAPIEKVM